MSEWRGIPEDDEADDFAKYESMSPIQVEQWLRRCVTRISQAEQALRKARDEETAAELEFQRAWRRAVMSPDCPKPNRTEITVAYRDAWCETQCEVQYELHKLTKTVCKSAEDHVRTIRDIATTVMAIGAGMRASLALAGHHGGA